MQNRIVTYFRPAFVRAARYRPAFLGVFCFMLFGIMAAFAIAPADTLDAIEVREIVEPLPLLEMTSLGANSDDDFFNEERVLSSDTIGSVLNRLGIGDPSVFDFIRRNEKTLAIARQMRPGSTLTAIMGARGEFKALYFPLNLRGDNILAVTKTDDGFAADEKTLEFEPHIVLKSGEIRNSLFGATDAVGIPDAIALQIADIFGGVIDFHRDLRKGDRFSIAYETLTHTGNRSATRPGRILGVEFINNQKTYTAYLFKTENGKEAYYSADGTSLRRAFLRSPLEFSRVTSGFSRSRFHPILKTWRSHRGVDYGAPTGTRVRTVADGRVEFVGRKNGYGNLIVVRHRGVFSTAYAHLSGYAPGIKKGTLVTQGDIIGYVGQTGLATGPHLHYEFRVNSVQVNPLAIALPEAIPLEPAEIARFMTESIPQKAQVALARQIRPAGTAID